jgi:hypothetical protein
MQLTLDGVPGAGSYMGAKASIGLCPIQQPTINC